MSPFEALYRHRASALATYAPDSTKIGSLDAILSQRAKILKLLKENLVRARNKMVQQANLVKRTDKEFEVGAWVYLIFQLYRQISVQNAFLISLQGITMVLFASSSVWVRWLMS